MLSHGLPVRHHVVVYTHTRLSDPLSSDQLQTALCLDASEVQSATWLNRSMVAAIVSVLDDNSDVDVRQHRPVDFPDTIE